MNFNISSMVYNIYVDAILNPDDDYYDLPYICTIILFVRRWRHFVYCYYDSGLT